jgi:hypothetical protein
MILAGIVDPGFALKIRPSDQNQRSRGRIIRRTISVDANIDGVFASLLARPPHDKRLFALRRNPVNVSKNARCS